MRTRDTLCNLFEEGFLDPGKLCWLNNIQNLLNLSQKHDFLLRTCLGPVLKETHDNLLSQSGILLEKLNHTISQLGMIKTQTLGFVEWNQHLHQELLVFRLQRQ